MSEQNNFFDILQNLVDEYSAHLPPQPRSDSWEWKYLDLIRDILENGDDRVDRTGTGTRALFAKTLDIDLRKGFPAVTTKKLAWKSVKAELIWFLEGSSDERRLAEITHGTRDALKTTIWTDNANASYWKPKAEFEGDLGRVYGVQWRNWKTYIQVSPGGLPLEEDAHYVEGKPIDQLAELINKLKTNPTDRRMIISAWNPGELDQMALPPCHMMAQFFVSKGELSCQMYQRSVDTMLGLPFNIASYALLTHMLAQVCDLGVGRLVMNLGDVHIYKNHIEGAELQLDREPLEVPTLSLNMGHTEIAQFTMNDIALDNYKSLDAIKLDMAV
jgi:thymidylate synthase